MSDAKRKPRIGPLSTVGKVCNEMAAVYRLARRGELPIEDASRLVHMLAQLRAGLEGVALEERVEALEAKSQ